MERRGLWEGEWEVLMEEELTRARATSLYQVVIEFGEVEIIGLMKRSDRSLQQKSRS